MMGVIHLLLGHAKYVIAEGVMFQRIKLYKYTFKLYYYQLVVIGCDVQIFYYHNVRR